MDHLRTGCAYSVNEAREILEQVSKTSDKLLMPLDTWRWYKRITNPLLDSQVRIEPGASDIYPYQLAALMLVAYHKRKGTFKTFQHRVQYETGFPYEEAKYLAEKYGVQFMQVMKYA